MSESRAAPPRLDLAQLLIYAALFAGVIIAVGPFLWMISASFMTLSEVNLTRLLPAESALGELRDRAAPRQFPGYRAGDRSDDRRAAIVEHLRLFVEQPAHHRHQRTGFAGGVHPGRLRLRAHELHRAQCHLRPLHLDHDDFRASSCSSRIC